jgi:hypothetical protein
MAKAILKFDLTDPDDRMEHKRAMQSLDMALALWQIMYNSRKEMSHAIEALELKGTTVDAYEAINMYREKIGEIATEYGIDIDALIN